MARIAGIEASKRGKMNILIVDDHPANLRVLRTLLEANGHAVLTAGDGVEALAILGREHVDAIISDILMPKMDGYQLCYEVRISERLRHLPFIFHTATYTSPSDEKHCFELGADKYLRKPASPEVILAALQEVIQSPKRSPAPIATLDEAAAREAETAAITQALTAAAGNKSAAAKALQTDYKTLHLKMQRYGIKARDLEAGH